MQDKNSTPLVLKSPAKINLFLHVTGRLDNGFHRLETVFQFLDFSDVLEFQPAGSAGVTRHDNHGFTLPENDLITASAELLASSFNLTDPPGVIIKLNKNIPPGSGMGGGSSNAAVTLLALNRLWGLDSSREELLSIGAELGADVPVFIHGYSSWATGIGTRFKNFRPDPAWCCFCIPEVSVSTKRVFSHFEFTANRTSATEQDFHNGNTCNDLEPVTRALYPEVDDAFRLMNQYGAARMNGSGASLFIRCDTKTEAQSIQKALSPRLHCIVAKTLNDIRGLQL